MLLDLSKWRRAAEESATLDRQFEPASIALEGNDFRIVAPVVLTGEVQRGAHKLTVHVTGRLRTTLECDCSRCLDAFKVPVDASLDLAFVPASAKTVDVEQEVTDEELGVSFYRDDAIDLGDMIREQCYLALPMKPLCSADCKGLCPICGANRNREVCSCQAEWVDPRLEPLRKLRDR